MCQICETNEHSTNECPTLPSFRECLHEQAHALNSFQRPNHNPYSQMYNPGWRNHPNFSWKMVTIMHKLHSHHLKPTIISKIFMVMHFLILLPEEILRTHCMHSLKSKRQINTQLAQSMTDFKDTLAKVTSTLNFQEKGKFPSQPQQNPKKQYNANASSSGSQHMDQVKSVIITLHSGVRLLKNPFLNLVRKMMNQSLRVRKGLNLNIAKKRSPPVLLFPHAMTKQREVNHDSEIYKTFKQEEIEDEKGTENVVVDHLSRLPIDSISDITPIDDYFPDESLLSLSSMPWFAKNINFLDSGFLPAHWNYQRQRKVFKRSELLLG